MNNYSFREEIRLKNDCFPHMGGKEAAKKGVYPLNKANYGSEKNVALIFNKEGV